MDEMNFKPYNEQLPEILQKFVKNNPNKRYDNLYHLKTVDREGNIVDEAVGANVMTDWGLSDLYASGTYFTWANMFLYLGSGSTQPDPTSSSLSSIISGLVSSTRESYGSDDSYYAFSYDSSTKIWSVTYRVLQERWDYTAGGNNSYDIYELGIGRSTSASSYQSQFLTHSLIYDEHGVQTHITKSPNTRLYVTVYLKASISVKDIPGLFESGKFLYIKPTTAMRHKDQGSFYFCPVIRCENEMLYGYDGDGVTIDRYSVTNTASGSGGIVTHNKGIDSNNNTWFWQNNYLYTPGFLITDNDRYTYSSSATSYTFNGSYYKAGTKFAMFTLDKMPTPELLVTDYAYINSLSTLFDIDTTTYTGTEINTMDLIRLNNNFGLNTHPRIDEPETSSESNRYGWKRPYGTFPCTDFHITDLSLYDYQTKQFDIPVDYYDNPNKEYLDIQNRLYISLYVNFEGSNKTVYVFINMYLYDNSTNPPTQRVITSFNNSSMTLCATDEYWDPSTYEKIPDLSNVPASLGSKRYYIVTAGTVAQLKPRYYDAKTNANRFIINHDCHYIIPSTYNDNPYEMTLDTNPLFPKQIPSTPKTENYNPGSDYGGNSSGEGAKMDEANKSAGCKPIFNQTDGWFLTDYMLVYLNKNKECTYYDMTMDDGTVGCRCRRYKTANGDKILMFKAYHSTVVSTRTPRDTTYVNSKNDFTIFTLVDKNTAPTREDLSLIMSSTTSLSTSGNYHSYSWTDRGYLVAQRRAGANEFVIVDVYGDGTNATQTLISDAKHARAVIDTTYCVYYDNIESSDKHYIFKIYDMSTNNVIDSFEIADGSSYTINGVFGWRDHIYVSTTLDSVKTTYYYNIDTHALQSTNNTYMNFWASTSIPFWYYDTLSYDDFLIITDIGNTRTARIIYEDDPTTLVPLFDSSTIYSPSNSSYNIPKNCMWPSINLMNNGKSLILTLHHWYTTVCVDFGYIRDREEGKIRHIPYDHYGVHISRYELDGCVFPFNDGIIIETGATRRASGGSAYESPLCGRWYWLPLECCLPLHMEGYTNTINSYNQPINFGITKKLSWKATNLYSNIPSSE